MTSRSLKVVINGDVIGSITEEQDLWTFAYVPEWRSRPDSYALSPDLPLEPGEVIRDGASKRPVQWYFDNLLPEESPRSLLAADARINEADAFALLAHYGAESAGSLTLTNPEAEPVLLTTSPSLVELTAADLSDRIRALPRIPLNRAASKRMSLAGAQHKLPVVLEGETLYEPGQYTPSRQILKPEHEDAQTYPHSVANEWFVMRLAALAKIEVPDVYRRYVPEPVYLVDRFDRIQRDGEWVRVHAIDACQLLGVARTFKYTHSNLATLERLARLTRNPAITRQRLYRWLVFNVLVGNGDAHLKNLSFLVTRQGITLAPHYDLLSTAVYESKAFGRSEWPMVSEMSWEFGDVRHYGRLDRKSMLAAGHVLGIKEATCVRLVDDLRTRLPGYARQLISEIESQNMALLAERPELGPTLAGEMRCMRAIKFAIIQDVVNQLGQ